MDFSTVGQYIGMAAGGILASIVTFQQVYKRVKTTNEEMKVDTEVSGGTIEIIRLLREQNAAAAAAASVTADQYEKLIAINAARYAELLETNNALYETINELQGRINELNSRIGSYQMDNQKLQLEIVALRDNNGLLTEQVTKLTSEVHKLRRGVS